MVASFVKSLKRDIAIIGDIMENRRYQHPDRVGIQGSHDGLERRLGSLEILDEGFVEALSAQDDFMESPMVFVTVSEISIFEILCLFLKLRLGSVCEDVIIRIGIVALVKRKQELRAFFQVGFVFEPIREPKINHVAFFIFHHHIPNAEVSVGDTRFR